MGKVAVAVIVSLWVISISILVNHIVPEPYMDEIFHIPQAQQYCIGNFRSWDPMITTPPGLYYLSLVHVASLFPGMSIVQAASSFSEVCTTAILRSVNGVLAVLCSILVCCIAYCSACYVSCMFEEELLVKCSGKLGALAVVIRQTNIVWMLFVACTGVINVTLVRPRDNVEVNDIDTAIRKSNRSTSNDDVTSGSNLRLRKFSNSLGTDKHSMPSASLVSTNHSSGLLDEVKVIFLALWYMKWELLVSFSPFLVVFVAFLAFIRWNGSVVLGAKEAHTVSPHFAQIMYFGLVSALAVAPLHCSKGQVVDLFRSFWKRRLISFFQVFVAVIAGFFSVHFFSIAHPYLIADNRHYPFYLWRKVINAHWSMKYLLVPPYVYSWFSIFITLGRVQRKIWVLAFFLATAAVLVPAPLIEFRYYTIPFYFIVLHSHINDYQSWLLMGLLYLAVNIFTMMIFLFRPYHWDHELGIQRFIW
ncbi:dol-P-Glc:Glc(2)Man(9)GlcNAc(2)-PP-Dol alpha-1,2-glucosyltransferase-like isoform X3 [Quercus lobata]|uniref:dol-P-Glc:Glc(2)Man(9)GlcNAc(2)-PP-Dol alpha-1,2-glucosyltransferase-like isoform X3 n=1 Tax=Quercus lobata TaxID=97700 RepID=UPI001247F2A2|nr:dol-P-Glc:Glc(2)Man(9)GlcNAc(2)-PP-Dol alpha-1,2-glucosyltransferase-like isoform X3 [Quercus lobata]